MLVSTVALIARQGRCGRLPCRRGRASACPSAWPATWQRGRAGLVSRPGRQRVAPSVLGSSYVLGAARTSPLACWRALRLRGRPPRRLSLPVAQLFLDEQLGVLDAHKRREAKVGNVWE